MVSLQIAYEGQLHCKATHEPSGAQISTDAPKDNHGLGESFSPTDLLATALGTCMLTLMGIAARKMGVELGAAQATVQKEMTNTPPRRVSRLGVSIWVPVTLTPEQQQILRAAALTCPVHKSLHPDIEIPVEFQWG